MYLLSLWFQYVLYCKADRRTSVASEKSVSKIKNLGITGCILGQYRYEKSERVYDMSLKGTKTEQNLLAAFAGESMAANKYDFFAQQASKEGYEQIGGYFQETAYNERQHAKRIFHFLGGIGSTEENLKAGANGEREEWTDIYQSMEETARAEGFGDIAIFFKNLASVEKQHEERYATLLKLLQEKRVFQDTEQTVWVCRNCGFVYVGKEAPKKCPVCEYPQGYFERKSQNY